MGRQLCRASGFALYAFATVSQASIATRVPEDFGVISGRKEFGVYLDGTPLGGLLERLRVRRSQ
jgi:hypothetical protein